MLISTPLSYCVLKCCHNVNIAKYLYYSQFGKSVRNVLKRIKERRIKEMENLKHWLKHLLKKNKKQIVFKYINGVEWMCWECLECGMITKIKKVK